MMRKIIAALLLACLIVLLSGCNTLHGMGKDIEKAGEGIQKATK